MKKLFTLSLSVAIVFNFYGSYAQDTLRYENFNSYDGTTVPSGWTITYNNSTSFYTTASSSGPSGPNSYKFGIDGATVIPPSFSGADSVHFWVKGNSTNTASIFYALESADSINWDTIAAITPLSQADYPNNQVQHYPVKLTSKWLQFYYTKGNGNAAFDDFLLTGPEPVSANFSAPNVCLGDTTCFTDMSTSVDGAITSWVWNFGDGSFSSSPNPCHIYASEGTYTVTLIVTNGSAEVDSISKQMSVFSAPDAAFVFSGFCTGNATQFTDNTTITSGNIVSWNWNFGDGGSDSLTNPSHTYFTAGNYSAALTVTSDFGCADSITNNIDIYASPAIDTSSVVITNPGCGASDGSITGIAVSGSSPFVYVWTPSVQSTLDLTNASGGNYSFEVIDSNNCSASVIFSLISSGAPSSPTVSDTAVSYCNGDSIGTLTATGTGGGIITWYEDTALASVVANGNTYAPDVSVGENDFYVTETVSGCEGPAAMVLVTVNQNPVVDFLVDSVSGCESFAVNIQNSTTGMISCLWNFGDGTQLSDCSSSVAHVYSLAGIYTVQLTVTDSNGCSGSGTLTVIVAPDPVAEFYWDMSGTFGDTALVQFTDSSTNAVAWFWNFGDGSTSTLQNPTHEYDCSFVGMATLTVTSSQGCVDDTSKQVDVICESIHETIFSQLITISPNPSIGKFQIFSTNNEPISTINVSNILGEIIFNDLLPTTHYQLDLTNKPEGVYFVTIESGEKVAVKKVVLVK